MHYVCNRTSSNSGNPQEKISSEVSKYQRIRNEKLVDGENVLYKKKVKAN